ncbi:OLC1v1016525C1 [Oldenlandia corymbosa var. corymbosa]|uniref:OLC1v1016525C1 n=1 Tax=Oldenlandia corymbosa var. corymbosa TaxID=529605 RepID=A0AAV1E653_OLDCO|nr:OLC1v1016525C1 [Oldenlandia corymbosa var. corymbosa]
MAPCVKQTARRRTLQIEGSSFPWVQSVLPLVSIPDSDNNESDKAGIERRLNEPRDWNLFHMNKVWEFYKENRKRKVVIERRFLNEGERRYIFVRGFTLEVSTEAIREVLGLSEVHNDWQADVASLPVKVDIWNFIKRVLYNNHKEVEWTLDKHGDPKSFDAKHLKDECRGWFNFVCTNIIPSNSRQHVSFNRALLVYAIVKDVTINVAPIISQ